MEQMLTWARGALALAKGYTTEHLEALRDFGSFPSSHLSLVRDDGALDLYHGGLRAITADGETIFDHVDYQEYLDFIMEEVRPWSYMKFPFIRSLGPAEGWYRVGPLARVNACDFIDTPEAEAARREFAALTDGMPNNVTMAYHWARMIELLHAAEKIRDLLHDDDLQGSDLVVRGRRHHEAVGVIEAPRGTLFHHYRVNDEDQVTMANLIVSTTHNNEPMNRAVRRVAEDYLSGQQMTEGLLNRVEVAIRAYDPCLSCATHALGQMPLKVELFDHAGALLGSRCRG
jgi:NAD-reducing hydrogenase large subunit